jgi:hypothetical protein
MNQSGVKGLLKKAFSSQARLKEYNIINIWEIIAYDETSNIC